MHTSQSKRAPHLLTTAIMTSLCIALFFAFPLQAAITGASGRVESTVLQTNASTGQTIDRAIEESPGTTNILPATADAALDITSGTDVQGRIEATAAVNVPGENAPENTNDFALEAAGLSLLADRGFTSTATATQTRQITLRAAELNRRSGSQVQIRSNFVLSAGVFLVTLPDGPTDVVGRIDFTIQQQDDDGSREVLAGSLDVSFDANGGGFTASGNIMTQATGDLIGIAPIMLDLTGTSGKVQQAWLILLPNVTLPYQYQAVVDQPFTLTATVTTSVTSAAGDQAGSAFFGRLPRLLADSADEFLQINFADDLDVISETLQNGTGLPGGIEIIPTITDLIPACGSFGFEAQLGGLLLAVGFVVRRFA